jgi:hypothetical protein
LTTIRAVFLIVAFAASLALASCGGAGSGGAGTTAAPSAAPALGTNRPVPSGDPYSDYDYGY